MGQTREWLVSALRFFKYLFAVPYSHSLHKYNSGKWIEFDDDSPVPRREEDITKLSGGGKIIYLNVDLHRLWLAYGY